MATAPATHQFTYAQAAHTSPWHPLHGILGGFPVALFTGALVADIAYANTGQMQWANFAIWLIAGGLLMGVLAAVVGIVEAIVTRRTRRHRPRRPWLHSLATIFMLAFALVNAFVHSRDAWLSVMPDGLILSVIVTILAWATSWFGYSLQTRQEIA